MKIITWILTALLMTMIAYGAVQDRRHACDIPQLSQVLR